MIAGRWICLGCVTAGLGFGMLSGLSVKTENRKRTSITFSYADPRALSGEELLPIPTWSEDRRIPMTSESGFFDRKPTRPTAQLAMNGKALKIGPYVMSCTGANVEVRSQMRGPAMAGIGRTPGHGSLIFNPRALKQEGNDIIQRFIFLHECGHVHNGGSELGADCWAAKEAFAQGWFKEPELETWCKSVSDFPASSSHPSGARRCSHVRKCYQQAVAASMGQGSANRHVAGMASIRVVDESRRVATRSYKQTSLRGGVR